MILPCGAIVTVLLKAKQEKENQLNDLTPKERILLTATRLFASQGFDGTGLRELAAQAEVNLAMINYFFNSKKGLLKEILDGFFKGYLEIATKELAGTDDLSCKLTRFINSSVQYFDTEQEALLVTITELSHDDPEIVDHKAAWAKQMAEILQKEICIPLKEETGKEIPPTCMGPMLTSLMASRFLFSPLMKQVNPKAAEKVDTDRYAKMLTNMILHGLIISEGVTNQ